MYISTIISGWQKVYKTEEQALPSDEFLYIYECKSPYTRNDF